MQRVTSCMPTGVLFVRQSDEVEWKKVLTNTVHTNMHTHPKVLQSGLSWALVATTSWFVHEIVIHCLYTCTWIFT